MTLHSRTYNQLQVSWHDVYPGWSVEPTRIQYIWVWEPSLLFVPPLLWEMWLTFFTAVGVTLQLLIIREHTIPRNSLSVGCPSIPWALQACSASSISHFVYPSKLVQVLRLYLKWGKEPPQLQPHGDLGMAYLSCCCGIWYLLHMCGWRRVPGSYLW